jgi:hypothetical protein
MDLRYMALWAGLNFLSWRFTLRAFRRWDLRHFWAPMRGR